LSSPVINVRYSDHDPYCVFLIGEVDLANIGQIKDALRQAIESCDCERFVVEASQVTFIDLTGLNALLSLANSIKETSRHLVLARPAQRLRRLIDLASLSQALPMVDL
jgi:anti-anti-sigma factor